jgi:hypothetical protein
MKDKSKAELVEKIITLLDSCLALLDDVFP